MASAFVADGEAYLVPEGVPEPVSCLVFAPANYIGDRQQLGVPYYGKLERLPVRQGRCRRSPQSNPLPICTRPRAIIKTDVLKAAPMKRHFDDAFAEADDILF